MMPAATRMCPECLTTDASFPKKPDCQSCKAMVDQDEWLFWNSLGTYDEEGWEITVELILKSCIQPWKAFFDMLYLG